MRPVDRTRPLLVERVVFRGGFTRVVPRERSVLLLLRDLFRTVVEVLLVLRERIVEFDELDEFRV